MTRVRDFMVHYQLLAVAPRDTALDAARLMTQQHVGAVLVMEGGRIVADGAPEAIFRDEPLLARCHLEAPLRWQR